jgi:hypothetical protein
MVSRWADERAEFHILPTNDLIEEMIYEFLWSQRKKHPKHMSGVEYGFVLSISLFVQ